MHNATKGRYCGINQEMCRAFAKCCTLCGVDVYQKAKKVRLLTYADIQPRLSQVVIQPRLSQVVIQPRLSQVEIQPGGST